MWPFRPMLLLCPLHAVNGLPPNHQPLKRLEPRLCLASYEGVRRTLIICFEINLVPNFSLISPNLISPITNFTVIQSSHMVVCFFFKLFHTLSGWGGKENRGWYERGRRRERKRRKIYPFICLCALSVPFPMHTQNKEVFANKQFSRNFWQNWFQFYQ